MALQGEPETTSVVGRREFVRRALMTAAAAATAGPLLSVDRLTRLAAAETEIPPLRAPGRVGGLAATPSGLVAVGMVGELPSVWTYRFGDRSWRLAADASAFPEGTGLAGVAAAGEALFAAGSITEHVRLGVLHDHDAQGPPRPVPAGEAGPSGPPASHESGRSVPLEGHRISPAIFASADGQRWEVVWRGAPDVRFGALNAIASLEGSRILAVGPQFGDLDVEEPSSIFGVISAGGGLWQIVGLGGVDQPRHGDVTLLAAIGDNLLLATTSISGPALYVASRSGPWLDPHLPGPVRQQVAGPLGPFRRIEAPAARGPVSFVAAGPIGSDVLLAGIDGLDQPRYWRLQSGTWQEAGIPEGLTAQSKPYDFEPVDESLVAGGSEGEQTVVAKVRG